jgi:hypothetical protein
VNGDPFAVLGLPARAGLSDEDVRAAWRRIAAATHPDRDDGGDPARFGAAAAAYDTLRTSFGRGEALADLGLAGSARRPAHRAARHARPAGVRRLGAGLRAGGRGRRLALRAAAAAGVVAAALAAVGWTPATVGLLAGALTWLAVTCRADLPGRGDQLWPVPPGCRIQSVPVQPGVLAAGRQWTFRRTGMCLNVRCSLGRLGRRAGGSVREASRLGYPRAW